MRTASSEATPRAVAISCSEFPKSSSTETRARHALCRALSGPAAAPSACGRGLSCHGPQEPLVAWYEGTTRCRRRRPSVSHLRRRAGKARPSGRAAAAERPGELAQSIGKPPARWRRWRSPLLLPAAGSPGMDARREAGAPRSGFWKWLRRPRRHRPVALSGRGASAARGGGVRPALCVYGRYAGH